MLQSAYIADDDGKYDLIDGDYVPNEDVVELTAMLRVMVLHGGPPESQTKDLARRSSRSSKTARGCGHGSRRI
jgi:hypothetical protein